MSSSEETLVRLHSVLLGMLFDLKGFLDRNGIPFFLDGGTALGALRHSGFIPWDDDLDIGILRPDYERFLSLCRGGASLPPGLTLQCFDTDHRYADGFARVRLLGTKFVIPYHKERGYRELGVFIDVFPYDPVGTLGLGPLREREKQIAFWDRMIANRLAPRHPSTKSKLLHCSLAFIPPSRLMALRDRAIASFSVPTAEAKGFTNTHSSYPLPRNLFPASCILPLGRTAQFEGAELPVVRDLEAYCEIVYGDWKSLPPPEKRHGHLPAEIELP